MNSPNDLIIEQLQIAEKVNHLNKKKKFKQVKRWLLDIDSFGHQVKLGFENHLVHKTYLGSFFTVVLIVLVAILIYGSVNTLILKQDPSVIRSDMLIGELDNQLELPLDFVIVVAFQNITTGEYFNPKGILKMSAFNQIHKNTQTNYISIPLVPCQRLHFTQNSYQLFSDDLEQGNIYCIENPKLIQQLKMFGQVGDDNFNNILFQIDNCDLNNQSSSDNCIYDNSTTQSITNNTRFKIQFTDFLFYPNDYSTPYQTFKRSLTQVLSNNHITNYDLFFSESYIFTDSGYITTDYHKQKFPNYSAMDRQTATRDITNGEPLYILQSSVEPKGVQYQRSYQKLQVLMGTIGGFMKALFSLFFFVSAPFVKLSLKADIVNRIFNFSNSQDEEGRSSDDKCPAQELQKEQEMMKVSPLKVQQQDDSSTKHITNQNNQYFNQLNMCTSNPTQAKLQDYSIDQKKPILTLFPERQKAYLTPIVSNLSLQPFSNGQLEQNKGAIKDSDDPSLRINQSESKLVRRPRKSTTKLIQNFFKTIIINRERDEDSPINIVLQDKEQKKREKRIETEEQAIKSEQKLSNKQLKKTEEDLHKDKGDLDSIFRKLFKSNESILKMKCSDYISYFLNKITLGCFKFTKKEQISNSMKKVSERMDIIFILKKLIEVDKLKMLLLNDDQRKIFDYLPRPVVSLNHKDRKSSATSATDINQSLFDKHQGNLYEQWNNMFLHQETGYIQKCVQAYYAFQNIKKKNSKDMLDQRLLDFMDPHKKRFFNTDHEDQCEAKCSMVLTNQNKNLPLIKEQLDNFSRKRSQSAHQITQPKILNIPENQSIEGNFEDSCVPNENITRMDYSLDYMRKFQIHTLMTSHGSELKKTLAFYN